MSGHLPSIWGFLSNATYVGKDIFHDVDVDLWDAQTGGVYIRLGVRAPEYWRPIFMQRRRCTSLLSFLVSLFSSLLPPTSIGVLPCLAHA